MGSIPIRQRFNGEFRRIFSLLSYNLDIVINFPIFNHLYPEPGLTLSDG